MLVFFLSVYVLKLLLRFLTLLLFLSFINHCGDIFVPEMVAIRILNLVILHYPSALWS